MSLGNVRLALLAAVGSVVFSSVALAGYGDVLNVQMAADDNFSVFVSHDPAVLGYRVNMGTSTGNEAPNAPWEGSVGSWSAAYQGNFIFDNWGPSGSIYNGPFFVNVVAQNVGTATAWTSNPGGIIGKLTLTSNDLTLANGSLTMTTSEFGFWKVAKPADTSAGNNWGFGPILPTWQPAVEVAGNDAHPLWDGSPIHAMTGIPQDQGWLWSGIGDTETDGGIRIFQTRIAYMAVPEPTTMLLGSIALMPLLAYRRRSRKA